MKTIHFTKSVRWIISYITIMIMIIFISCVTFILYEPPIKEVEIEIYVSPVFAYPITDPEFLQSGNIIVSYEFITEERHLISVDNNGKQYILPLFDTRETALDFMNQYFIFLQGLRR